MTHQPSQDHDFFAEDETVQNDHDVQEELRPNFPVKVRFFAPMYAWQRGIIRTVGDDHCMVQLNGQDHEVKIPMEDLMYWDDEDEAWASLPSTYYDDEDLNSAEHDREEGDAAMIDKSKWDTLIDQLTDEERNMAFDFVQFLLWRRDREELKALHEPVGETEEI